MLTSTAFCQGDLNPPANAIDTNGAPLATMKSLNQIEPRTLIPHLPFDIAMPGSYYLSPAQPLSPVGGTNGITISVPNVRLDLNGFVLMGTNTAIDGIKVMQGCGNVVIRNGVIANWGGMGINADTAPEIAIFDIKAVGNGSGGIYAGDNALVERCSAFDNGRIAPPDDGIKVGPYSTVNDCKSRENRGANIHAYDHSRVIGCTASGSVKANGIWAQNYCTIRDCVVSCNSNSGINVGSMCRVTENTCGQNGTNSTPPVAGIIAQGNNNVIERNIVCDNRIGINLFGSGNLAVHNSASHNTSGDIMPTGGFSYSNNFIGKVVSFSAGGGGGFSTNNSWANFTFYAP
jgi:parallel beta-helix repeat protein